MAYEFREILFPLDHQLVEKVVRQRERCCTCVNDCRVVVHVSVHGYAVVVNILQAQGPLLYLIWFTWELVKSLSSTHYLTVVIESEDGVGRRLLSFNRYTEADQDVLDNMLIVQVLDEVSLSVHFSCLQGCQAQYTI